MFVKEVLHFSSTVYHILSLNSFEQPLDTIARQRLVSPGHQLHECIPIGCLKHDEAATI